MECNTTGPPWTDGSSTAREPGPPAGSITDDDRRQRANEYWPIRRASNNKTAELNDLSRIIVCEGKS